MLSNFSQLEVAVTFLSDVITQIWLDPLRGFWGCWETLINNFFQLVNSLMPILASEGCLWPLTASITSEVKIDYRLCYHARHLQQINWIQLLCWMYGFMAKSSIATLNICQILMRRKDVIVDPNLFSETIDNSNLENAKSFIAYCRWKAHWIEWISQSQ